MHVKVNQASFDRQMRKMDRLAKEVAQNAYIATDASAKEYASLVRSGIAVTSPPSFAPKWKALSEQWKAAKTGHKEEFWAETLGILHAVKTKLYVKTTRFIHMFSGIRKESDNDAFERATRNEYGFGLGPARPLFEPAKDVIAPVRGAGRRLKNKIPFIMAVRKAIRKIYK